MKQDGDSKKEEKDKIKAAIAMHRVILQDK